MMFIVEGRPSHNKFIPLENGGEFFHYEFGVDGWYLGIRRRLS
jgi:hypothetical protein